MVEAKAKVLAKAEARGKAKDAPAKAEAEEKHEALIDRTATEMKVGSQDYNAITIMGNGDEGREPGRESYQSSQHTAQ